LGCHEIKDTELNPLFGFRRISEESNMRKEAKTVSGNIRKEERTVSLSASVRQVKRKLPLHMTGRKKKK